MSFIGQDDLLFLRVGHLKLLDELTVLRRDHLTSLKKKRKKKGRSCQTWEVRQTKSAAEPPKSVTLDEHKCLSEKIMQIDNYII